MMMHGLITTTHVAQQVKASNGVVTHGTGYNIHATSTLWHLLGHLDEHIAV